MIFTLRSGGTAHPETSVLQNITDLISSSGILSITGNQFKAEAQAVPDMTVKIKIGRAYIKGSLTNSYPVRSDADDSVTIVPNSSGNPRIDTIVLFIDLSAAANLDASNVAKLQAVQGTPAASPVAPTTAEIQTAIGSANPFTTLANVAVASGATSITNPNITDIRTQAIFTIGGGGSTSFINNETPTGAVDGVNLTFTAAFPYVGGSLMVFRDGQLMTPTAGFDYTETNPATGVFDFYVAPATGSIIRISYQKVVSTTGNADTVDGFHANSTPTPNQLQTLDGTGKFPVSTIPNPLTVTMAQNPTTGSLVTTSGTFVDVINTSVVVVPVSTAKVLINVSAVILNGVATADSSLQLVRDSTPLELTRQQFPDPNSREVASMTFFDTLTPGSHTYKVQALTNNNLTVERCRVTILMIE